MWIRDDVVDFAEYQPVQYSSLSKSDQESGVHTNRHNYCFKGMMKIKKLLSNKLEIEDHIRNRRYVPYFRGRADQPAVVTTHDAVDS